LGIGYVALAQVRVDQPGVRGLPEGLAGDHRQHQLDGLEIPSLSGQSVSGGFKCRQAHLSHLFAHQVKPAVIPGRQQVDRVDHQLEFFGQRLEIRAVTSRHEAPESVHVNGDTTAERDALTVGLHQPLGRGTDPPQRGPQTRRRPVRRRVRPQSLAE